MFKNVGSRSMRQDTPGTVERPIERAGLRKDESEALAILEDPIEFGQNISRVLKGGELLGVLSDAMPVIPQQHLEELQRMLREAIGRRDWEAVDKIADRLNDETMSATIDAEEYGIAIGAVMEQLRSGLLEVARLRSAGMTSHDRRVASEIAELRSLLNLRGAVQESRKHAAAAD